MRRKKNFVTSVDDRHVILVKALEQSEGYEAAQQIAKVITDTLNMESAGKCAGGIWHDRPKS